MRIPHALIPTIRITAVVLFAALCTTIFSFLWLNAGGKIPLISSAGYRVDVTLPDVDNLVFQSDVRMAGVEVGQIENIEIVGSSARVTLELNGKAAPLHEGATVTVRNKTMIEETYLEVDDGDGPEIPSGQKLPDDAGRPAVQLDDVLATLDQPTRDSLRNALRSAGVATEGSKKDVGKALQGLGDLGREGARPLAALADQSADLKKVTVNTTNLLRALDTRQGRITQLVRDSNVLTGVLADNRQSLESLMRELPHMLDTTATASRELTRLAGGLAPVAANLKAASGDLSGALQELPATSADLRGLLPALNRTLDRAPGTLDRVPGFSDALRPLLSTVDITLADVNPMLAYMKPYGRDIAAYFTNFSQYLSGADGNGKIGRVMPVFNGKSLNSPLNTQQGPLRKTNPYPAPGSSPDPENFHGEYPRVEEAGPR